jgi:hypothetical protein
MRGSGRSSCCKINFVVSESASNKSMHSAQMHVSSYVILLVSLSMALSAGSMAHLVLMCSRHILRKVSQSPQYH